MGSGVGDGGREREGRWKERERQNGRQALKPPRLLTIASSCGFITGADGSPEWLQVPCFSQPDMPSIIRCLVTKCIGTLPMECRAQS